MVRPARQARGLTAHRVCDQPRGGETPDNPTLPGLEPEPPPGLPLLRLRRAIPAGERRPRSPSGGRDRRHDDLPGHGRRIRETIADITMRHQRRPQVLGVDPRLMLVFELGASIDADEFRRAGLRVVDSSDGLLVVAFADDPELAAFRERLDAFAGGIPEGRKSEPHAQFFDAIDHVRPLAPQDRVTPELASAIPRFRQRHSADRHRVLASRCVRSRSGMAL